MQTGARLRGDVPVLDRQDEIVGGRAELACTHRLDAVAKVDREHQSVARLYNSSVLVGREGDELSQEYWCVCLLVLRWRCA